MPAALRGADAIVDLVGGEVKAREREEDLQLVVSHLRDTDTDTDTDTDADACTCTLHHARRMSPASPTVHGSI